MHYTNYLLYPGVHGRFYVAKYQNPVYSASVAQYQG